MLKEILHTRDKELMNDKTKNKWDLINFSFFSNDMIENGFPKIYFLLMIFSFLFLWELLSSSFSKNALKKEQVSFSLLLFNSFLILNLSFESFA